MSNFICRLSLLARTYSALFAERASIAATCLKEIDNWREMKEKKDQSRFRRPCRVLLSERNCTQRCVCVCVYIYWHPRTRTSRKRRQKTKHRVEFDHEFLGLLVFQKRDRGTSRSSCQNGTIFKTMNWYCCSSSCCCCSCLFPETDWWFHGRLWLNRMPWNLPVRWWDYRCGRALVLLTGGEMTVTSDPASENSVDYVPRSNIVNRCCSYHRHDDCRSTTRSDDADGTQFWWLVRRHPLSMLPEWEGECKNGSIDVAWATAETRMQWPAVERSQVSPVCSSCCPTAVMMMMMQTTAATEMDSSSDARSSACVLLST